LEDGESVEEANEVEGVDDDLVESGDAIEEEAMGCGVWESVMGAVLGIKVADPPAEEGPDGEVGNEGEEREMEVAALGTA
jgi:hypothetical protein